MSDSTNRGTSAGSATARPTSAGWNEDGSTTTSGGDGSQSDDGSSSASAVDEGEDYFETVSLSVPDDATDEEVAAIAAAIGAYLRERERSAGEHGAKTEDRWTLSARLMQVGRQPAGIPPDVPADRWIAAGRMR